MHANTHLNILTYRLNLLRGLPETICYLKIVPKENVTMPFFWHIKPPSCPHKMRFMTNTLIILVRYHFSPVTCHMSLTPIATATDPPPAYSPTMHSTKYSAIDIWDSAKK